MLNTSNLSVLGGCWINSRPKRQTVRSVRRCGYPSVVMAKKGNTDLFRKIERLCDKAEKQISGLRSELQEVKMGQTGGQNTEERKPVELDISNGGVASLELILNQILDRQETFFKEERDFWLDERASWRRQEAELRREIARLQGLLFQTPSKEDTDNLPNKPQTSTSEKHKEPEMLSKVDSTNIIATAISAVKNDDVLSPTFDPLRHVPGNGASAPAERKEDTENNDPPLETVKGPPTGPPPTLTQGDDDIYWVSQLQEALNQKGFYCGDDDVEDFYFGEGTVSALLTFQACQGIKETGITDDVTWKELLGSELKPVIGNLETQEKTTPMPGTTAKQNTSFPVLSELDGGKDVHCLQVLLEIAGYSCGKDDMQWWHYGDDTIAAMKTFQACNGLPQSGVADENTWKLLIGEGKTMTDVQQRVQQENIFEEDLTNTDRVWLLGEQRWERKL